MLVAADFAFVLDHLVVHTGEQVGPIVIIILRPAVEGMIVALGALQARAEKHLRGSLGSRRRVAVGTKVIRGRAALGAAARGNEFAHESVERFVLSDALTNPV